MSDGDGGGPPAPYVPPLVSLPKDTCTECVHFLSYVPLSYSMNHKFVVILQLLTRIPFPCVYLPASLITTML